MGTSHHSWVRWPNTTPSSRTCCFRSCQGTRPATRQVPSVGVRMPVSSFTVVDLARAVGADEPHQLPGLHLKADVIQGLHRFPFPGRASGEVPPHVPFFCEGNTG